MRLLAQAHDRGEDLRAEAVEEERALPVEAPAAHRRDEVPEEAVRHWRFEEHPGAAGADLPAAQARERPAPGVVADRLGPGKISGRALRRVPIVALHRVALGGDHRAG